MKPLMTILAGAGLALALAACQPDQGSPLAYRPESKENLLADSGFRQLPVNTPKKIAMFKQYPAHRLSKTTYKGKTVWVYPDQNVCGCLYIGGPTAYATFLKKGRAQMIDTRVNQMYQTDDPYNPTATMEYLNVGDAWDDADAYDLYLN